MPFILDKSATIFWMILQELAKKSALERTEKEKKTRNEVEISQGHEFWQKTYDETEWSEKLNTEANWRKKKWSPLTHQK